MTSLRKECLFSYNFNDVFTMLLDNLMNSWYALAKRAVKESNANEQDIEIKSLQQSYVRLCNWIRNLYTPHNNIIQ